MKILYANVDQLLNKVEDLKTKISDEAPDLMLFTEVIPKAQKNPIHEPLMKISGFNLYTNFKFTDSDLGTSGVRGVAIYVNEKMVSEKISLLTKYDDQLWVEIDLKGKDKLLCGCIYRSPTKEKEKTVSTTLKVSEIVNEAVHRNNSHLLICGDFNYPEIDWVNEHVNESTPVISPFIQVIQDNNLYQHVTEPTIYRHNQEPSLLDLILTNEEGMLSELIHKTGLGESDHECLHFYLSCYADVKNHSNRKNYHKGDYVTIRNRLQPIDWEEKLKGSFSEAYPVFIEELIDASKGCIPDVAKKKKNEKHISNPGGDSQKRS